MHLRAAQKKDAEIITDIYNDAVLTTTAIWNNKTVDVQNRIEWLEAHKNANFPVIVAVDESDNVMGYACYSDWRAAWEGYKHTIEHSVYVHKDARGKGVGKQLMVELIRLAQEQGKHVMVAAIESGNEASIALHKKLNFIETGHMLEVGTKFGRWLDLSFLQLNLDNRTTP